MGKDALAEIKALRAATRPSRPRKR
jgi:hypothetical protein